MPQSPARRCVTKPTELGSVLPSFTQLQGTRKPEFSHTNPHFQLILWPAFFFGFLKTHPEVSLWATELSGGPSAFTASRLKVRLDLKRIRVSMLKQGKRMASLTLNWLWVKNGYPKWNPGKWKHGLKPASSGGFWRIPIVSVPHK